MKSPTPLFLSDPLAPARGCVWSIIFGALLWAAAIAYITIPLWLPALAAWLLP